MKRNLGGNELENWSNIERKKEHITQLARLLKSRKQSRQMVSDLSP